MGYEFLQGRGFGSDVESAVLSDRDDERLGGFIEVAGVDLGQVDFDADGKEGSGNHEDDEQDEHDIDKGCDVDG